MRLRAYDSTTIEAELYFRKTLLQCSLHGTFLASNSSITTMVTERTTNLWHQSLYRNAGTDGKDLGADVSTILSPKRRAFTEPENFLENSRATGLPARGSLLISAPHQRRP